MAGILGVRPKYNLCRKGIRIAIREVNKNAPRQSYLKGVAAYSFRILTPVCLARTIIFLVFLYNCNLAQSLFALMTLTYWTFLISVFVHSKEDSIWLHLSIPPIRMTSIHMDILQRPDICGIEGVVTEKRIISLNKPHNPCLDYPDGQNEFVQCIKNYFIEYLKDKISCTLPGLYKAIS